MRLIGLVIVVVGLMAIPMGASAQTVLPGQTIGETCTIYKEIPADPEFVEYYQCRNGGTVKAVNYFAADGEMFQYLEFRDSLGTLMESRFVRESSVGAPAIPLADSVAP